MTNAERFFKIVKDTASIDSPQYQIGYLKNTIEILATLFPEVDKWLGDHTAFIESQKDR